MEAMVDACGAPNATAEVCVRADSTAEEMDALVGGGWGGGWVCACVWVGVGIVCPRGTGFPQLPSAVISTIDHP
jgi:hypothetical protein